MRQKLPLSIVQCEIIFNVFNLPFSATALSLVTGFALVISLRACAPSKSVYVICTWNGSSLGWSPTPRSFATAPLELSLLVPASGVFTTQ